MTVTTAYIDETTPYTLGATKLAASGIYTASMFTRFLARATEKFTVDNPGLGPEQSDEAVGYLVAHYIYLTFEGNDNRASGREENVSYTKRVDPETGEVVTEYLSRYYALIQLKRTRAVISSYGAKAADSMGAKAFALSNQRIPQMDYDDNSLVQPTVRNAGAKDDAVFP